MKKVIYFETVNKKRNHLPLLLGLLLTFVFCLTNLIIINDYGVTWDYTYHFNAGLWHLNLPSKVQNFVMFASNPIPDIIPTLSQLIFHDYLKLFTFDSAYNLFSVIIGSLGVGILYLFVSQLLNPTIGFLSALTLALTPRYVGHLHFNMKDIPQSVLFTLSLWLFFCFIVSGKKMHFIFASLSLSVLLLTKANAIFVPIIITIWIFIPPVKKPVLKTITQTLLFFVISIFFALIVWFIVWKNPVSRLIENIQTYTSSTQNMPVLYFGHIFRSGQNIPWHYPFGIIFATMPLPILVTFISGAVVIFLQMIKKNKAAWMIALWFVIPLSRFFKPSMLAIDYLRHFIEIVFPFTTISAVGLYNIIVQVKIMFFKKYSEKGPLILVFLYFVYLFWQNAIFHPYQASYFNELVTPQLNKNALFDTDYWAYSYKGALEWLNKNAPPNSKVTVAMVPDIAKLYLRDDLCDNLNTENMTHVDWKLYTESDYTVILNRRSFFQWYNIDYYINNREAEYIYSINDIPLVYFYKNL